MVNFSIPKFPVDNSGPGSIHPQVVDKNCNLHQPVWMDPHGLPVIHIYDVIYLAYSLMEILILNILETLSTKLRWHLLASSYNLFWQRTWRLPQLQAAMCWTPELHFILGKTLFWPFSSIFCDPFEEFSWPGIWCLLF